MWETLLDWDCGGACSGWSSEQVIYFVLLNVCRIKNFLNNVYFPSTNSV